MLTINSISFAYDKDLIIKDLNFTIPQGEHLAVIGESGSGKSTLLKLLYGTYDLKGGSIFYNNKQILGPKYNLIIGPEYMKYVAQEFELMPYTTVAVNIGEFLSNLYPKKKAKRVAELLDVVGLQEVAQTKVKYLSGGQKQRVALAKALAKEPKILLLDEPFSHIDNFKKHELRRNLFQYLKENAITCITATHDKEDVLGYADKMLVLNEGVKMAYGTPKKLYDNPANGLIAAFFGEYNTFNVSDISDSSHSGTICIYAHELRVSKNSGIPVRVKRCFFQGNRFLTEAVFKERSIFFYHKKELPIGTSVYVTIARQIIKKRLGKRR